VKVVFVQSQVAVAVAVAVALLAGGGIRLPSMINFSLRIIYVQYILRIIYFQCNVRSNDRLINSI
jgi:hypothetical protein